MFKGEDTMVRLAIQNEEFAQTDLAPEEMNLLVGQFNDLYFPSWSFERQYVGSKLETVKLFAAVAKNSLDEMKFGGFNCGNSEIGITPIRPGQVGLVNGVVPEADNVWKWKHDCRKEANAVGFENWIHSPTTATTAFAIQRDASFYPMYIVEENACPKIQTIKMDIGRTNILQYDVRASRIRDYQTGLNLIPLPTTFWLGDMDVLVALGFMYSGVTEPRLGGFCIAKGSFLSATSYAAATNTVAVTTTASV
jgi:hypothetical protein